MFEYKVTGKTISEAINKGIETLKVEKEAVKIKVLKNAKNLSNAEILIVVPDEIESQNEEIKKLKSFQTLDKEISLIENKLNKTRAEKNEILEYLKTEILKEQNKDITQEEVIPFCTRFLADIFNICKVGKYEILINDTLGNTSISIKGENLGKFIGFQGKTLASLQYILNTFAGKLSRKTKKIFLDINNYKAKKVEQIENLATEKAKSVQESGEKFCFEPMNAFERRVVHNIVSKFEDLETLSEGEEPNRYVVIRRKD